MAMKTSITKVIEKLDNKILLRPKTDKQAQSSITFFVNHSVVEDYHSNKKIISLIDLHPTPNFVKHRYKCL